MIWAVSFCIKHDIMCQYLVIPYLMLQLSANLWIVIAKSLWHIYTQSFKLSVSDQYCLQYYASESIHGSLYE